MKTKILSIAAQHYTDEEMLAELQRETFDYFLKQVNEKTGLVADKTAPGSPASIAVAGMALTTYITGIQQKFVSRKDGARRILKMLRFFDNSNQSTEKNATGYKGFYYHFLDMNTGERFGNCELSTIDTALLMAGALTASAFFTSYENEDEKEITTLADRLYRKVDWRWALNKKNTLSHGWKPGRGFLKYRWDKNYSEAMLLYILAMGSPAFPISPGGYHEWTNTFSTITKYDTNYLYAGPLFIHQFSHLWIDFRGINDRFNMEQGFDYFENSRRAAMVHRAYAIENSGGFEGYGKFCWGLTASDGPGKKNCIIKGKKRKFYDYLARGAPFGPDDGTVSPWAVVASLPFAPDAVLATIRHDIERLQLLPEGPYGFAASFNPTFPDKTKNPNGWVSPWRFGLNEGPVIIMIDNYNTGYVWQLMRSCPYIISGLQKAGFKGGWLDGL